MDGSPTPSRKTSDTDAVAFRCRVQSCCLHLARDPALDRSYLTNAAARNNRQQLLTASKQGKADDAASMQERVLLLGGQDLADDWATLSAMRALEAAAVPACQIEKR